MCKIHIKSFKNQTKRKQKEFTSDILQIQALRLIRNDICSFTPSIKSKPQSAVQPCLRRFPPRFSSRLRREKRGGKEHGARPPAVCGLITGAKLRPTWRMAVMRRRSVFHYSRSNLMGYADVPYKRLKTYQFQPTDRVLPALSAHMFRRAATVCFPPCFHPLCKRPPFGLRFAAFYVAIRALLRRNSRPFAWHFAAYCDT